MKYSFSIKLLPVLALAGLSFLPVRAEDTPAPVANPNAPINVSDYPAPIRVACLGDSITYGVGAGPGWAWPDQLDRMLGKGWDVRNFGHSGATVVKGDKHTIWTQKEYTNARDFHPDVAIILLGTNDTKPENYAKKRDFPKLYKTLVTSFQKLSSNPRVFCGTIPYVAKKGAFGINEANSLELIKEIQQVAADWGAGVIDIHAATAGHDEWFGDNVHPKKEGATAIAAAVYKALTGKDWVGEVPGARDVIKPKPVVKFVEKPGELSYKECFGLIATAGIPADQFAPIQEKFDATASEVDAKIVEYQNQIAEYGTLRMKFKHSTDPNDQKLYGEYRSKGRETEKELEQYKKDMNLVLIGMIPNDYKDEFGTSWVYKYVNDRLAVISSTLTPEQRKKIREMCKGEGATYGHINNTPERSIQDVEVYKDVYEQVLTPDQKKRVEPK